MSLPSKRITLSLCTLAAVAFVFGLWLSVAPAPANAAYIPDPCPGTQSSQTPMVWGMGSDCSAALNDATSQAFTHARNDCGRVIQTCDFQFVPTASCWYKASTGQWVQDGYGIYDCVPCSPPEQ